MCELILNLKSKILKSYNIHFLKQKLLLMAVVLHTHELGDGSTFVVYVSGELLKQSESLIREGLNPSEIAHGYK